MIKKYDIVFYVFILGIFFGVFSMFLKGMQRDVFNDDAYYYTVTARNFAGSGEITFDGETKASGFHPLFWVMQAVAFMLAGDMTALEAYRLVNIIISFGLFMPLCIMGFMLKRQKDRVFGLIIMLSVMIALCPKNISVFYNGMESAVTLPLFAFFIYFLYQERYMAAGILGALLCSARLDSFLYIVLPVFIVYVIMGKREFRIIYPALIFLGTYLLFNFLYLGHFMPVSGILRSSFPFANLQLHNLFKNYMPVFCIIASVCGILLINKGEKAGRPGIALGICALWQTAGIILFLKWAKTVSVWYLGLPFISALVCFLIMLSMRSGERKFKYIIVSIMGILLMYSAITGISAYEGYDGSFELKNRDTVEFIRQKGGKWAYTDCGALSFWSGVDFVSLDGLMNDLVYHEYLKKGELGLYLKKRNVDYMLAGVWDRMQDDKGSRSEPVYRYRVNREAFNGDYDCLGFYAYSYLYKVFSEELKLCRKMEIYRSDVYHDGNAEAMYIAYKLKD